MKYDFDILVIGGGAAGLVSSGILAHMGARVGLVEKAELGGECLHTGCVPSKALIAAAHAWHYAGRTSALGLPSLQRGSIDLGAVMASVNQVVAGIQEHETAEVVEAEGVAEVIFGAARFLDRHAVEVDGRRLTAKKFILCTGSRPAIPPIEGLDDAGYLTNESIFGATRLPAHLAIVGAGPIGCEMAQSFARLGSRVSVIEMAPSILPSDDPELTQQLQSVLEGENVQFRLGQRVARVERRGETRVLTLEGDQGSPTLEADALLIAAGRAANVEGLNLEAAGVEIDRRGVVVNERLRTTAKHIWALGDVNGRLQFSHMAEAEGRAVAANIAFGLPAKARWTSVAWCTFTDPELAHVGLTEKQAREKHKGVKVLRFPVSKVDRALAERRTAGQAKVIVAGWQGHVVGAQILAPGAGELIQEWIVAVDRKLRADQVSGLIHVYPSYSLLNQRTADLFLRDWGNRPWVQRWLKRAYHWFG